MKKIMLIGLILLLACGARDEKVEKPVELEKGTYMHMLVKDYGEIKIKFYSKEAPNNVDNIVKLVNQGFYNGLIFHRVIKGFVIQGGCPKGDGTGDPGYEIADEVSSNLRHLKGTVAMANRGPNTNGSQFYICLEPLPRLDGRYTIIGQVVKGMDVVERIGEVKTGPRDKPIKDVVIERAWIEENE